MLLIRGNGIRDQSLKFQAHLQPWVALKDRIRISMWKRKETSMIVRIQCQQAYYPREWPWCLLGKAKLRLSRNSQLIARKTELSLKWYSNSPEMPRSWHHQSLANRLYFSKRNSRWQSFSKKVETHSQLLTTYPLSPIWDLLTTSKLRARVNLKLPLMLKKIVPKSQIMETLSKDSINRTTK